MKRGETEDRGHESPFENNETWRGKLQTLEQNAGGIQSNEKERDIRHWKGERTRKSKSWTPSDSNPTTRPPSAICRTSRSAIRIAHGPHFIHLSSTILILPPPSHPPPPLPLPLPHPLPHHHHLALGLLLSPRMRALVASASGPDREEDGDVGGEFAADGVTRHAHQDPDHHSPRQDQEQHHDLPRSPVVVTLVRRRCFFTALSAAWHSSDEMESERRRL
eukprot:2651883-Rhodomonas_salina.2